MHSLKHIDMGKNGSQFVYRHPPLKHRMLFGLLFCIVSIVSFSLGLHLLDQKILSSLCLVLVISLIMKLSSKVHSETVLILPTLGIQVTTQFVLGRKSTHFIHLSHINDVIINEAFTMQCVIYYLVILIKNHSKPQVGQQLYPLFTHSRPRLNQLIEVFVVAQEKLALQKQRS